MEVVGPLVGLVLSAWLWHHSYNIFIACWFPARAGDRARLVVNVLGGRLFSFLRWTSPFLLITYSLGALLNVVLLGLNAWQMAAR